MLEGPCDIILVEVSMDASRGTHRSLGKVCAPLVVVTGDILEVVERYVLIRHCCYSLTSGLMGEKWSEANEQ